MNVQSHVICGVIERLTVFYPEGMNLSPAGVYDSYIIGFVIAEYQRITNIGFKSKTSGKCAGFIWIWCKLYFLTGCTAFFLSKMNLP